MIRRHTFTRIAVHAVLLLSAGLFLLPILWMLAGAFKTDADLFGPLLPWDDLSRLTFTHIRRLFADYPMRNWLFNSLFIAGTQTLGAVLLSSMAGFALAKHRFVGKRWLTALLLLTIMLPAQVLLPGLYDVVHHLGLIDTYAGVILPAIVSLTGVFLFRQSMLSIPDELLQAARVDGCGELRIWWEIALPVARPMVGAFTLLSFIGHWNNFIWPAIVLHDPARYPLPLALANLSGSEQFGATLGLSMAAVLVSTLPVIVLFLILQRDLVTGLLRGSGR